ncbi:Leucine Zipper Tumor Suppressor 1-Like [Manis pentadactyla]|nr:Leucine Zipper Tumor Suppressor 1-Like [Manis pentadactyla]
MLAPSGCSDCFRARLQPSKENGRAAGFPPGWICLQDLGVDSGVGLSFKVGVTKYNQIREPDVKGKCIRIPLKKGGFESRSALQNLQKSRTWSQKIPKGHGTVQGMG